MVSRNFFLGHVIGKAVRYVPAWVMKLWKCLVPNTAASCPCLLLENEPVTLHGEVFYGKKECQMFLGPFPVELGIVSSR
uniref:Uncharacterized protein n=1 Tax=Triticum urartu TaxID=4572 RepID=A0A8R7TNS4_TRIUA